MFRVSLSITNVQSMDAIMEQCNNCRSFTSELSHELDIFDVREAMIMAQQQALHVHDLVNSLLECAAAHYPTRQGLQALQRGDGVGNADPKFMEVKL